MSISTKDLEQLISETSLYAIDRFSAIVSNPPYQIDADGESTVTIAVYHHFMNTAQQFSHHISMIYPSRWTQGGIGYGLKEFRAKELFSPNYVKYYDFSSKFFFDNVIISGGVNFFSWDQDKTSYQLDYIYDLGQPVIKKSISETSQHFRDPRLLSIVSKVNTLHSMKEIVSGHGWYGELLKNHHRIDRLIVDDNGIKALYTKPGEGLISKMIPADSTKRDVLDWKVFVSRTASRVPGYEYFRPDRAFIAGPGEVGSGSFLKIGSFHTEQEANNCLKYIKTDFATKLFGIVTSSLSVGSRNYILVPLVDFKIGQIIDFEDKFLDFSQDNLDNQLSKIYNLDDEENALLSYNVRPWK